MKKRKPTVVSVVTLVSFYFTLASTIHTPDGSDRRLISVPVHRSDHETFISGEEVLVILPAVPPKIPTLADRKRRTSRAASGERRVSHPCVVEAPGDEVKAVILGLKYSHATA